MTKTASRRKKSVQQRTRWSVLRISGARLVYLGDIEADDAQEAIAKAADRFEVPPAHRIRLIARPSDI
jgi:hypothetical protein